MAESEARPGPVGRFWRRLPRQVPVAAAGVLLTAGAATAAAEAGFSQGVTLPRWWGSWPHRLPGQMTGWVAASIVLLGALCVFSTWLVAPLLRGPGAAQPAFPWSGPRIRFGLRGLVAALAAWCVPLAAGGPMGSLDVQSYAAIGRLAAKGLDPYRVSPSWLNDGFGAAVDPLWRWTPSPYGPLQLSLLRWVVGAAGNHVGLAVLLIRAVAVLGLVGAVAVSLRAAPRSARIPVLAVTAASPVVLIHVVSGAHLDVLIGALAVLVVVLTRAGRPGAAMALGVVACALKLPGAVLVAYVLLDVLRRTPATDRARALARTLGAGGVVTLAVVLICPDPFGWIPALRVPGIVRNGAAPSTWAAYLVGALTGHLSGPGLDWGFTVGRMAVALLGVAAVVALLWRATSGPRGLAFHGLGWALIALAVSGPSLYPWYLTWGLFAAAIGSGPRGRWALVGLGSTICLFSAMSPDALPASTWIVVTVGVLGFTVWAARATLGDLWPRIAGRPAVAARAETDPHAAIEQIRDGLPVG